MAGSSTKDCRFFNIFDKNIWWQKSDFGIEFFDFINQACYFSNLVTEDFVEEDLTDFVLETVPNSGGFIRCGSSSSNNDLPSSSSSSNSYSNDLK